MFVQILVALAVCAVFLSASSVQHADHGKLRDFDALAVPVAKEAMSKRFANVVKNLLHKNVAEHSQKLIARATTLAKKHMNNQAQKVELTTGSAGTKEVANKRNADCSGSASSVNYFIHTADNCLPFTEDNVPFSTRTLCAANGDEIVQLFTGSDCANPASESVSPAVKCTLDVAGYDEDKTIMMQSSRCVAGATPSFGAGLLRREYGSEDCTGPARAAEFIPFNGCDLDILEDGSYQYVKFLGCTANGDAKAVAFSDANCFHPIEKGVFSMSEYAGCDTVQGGTSDFVCHVPE